MATQTATVSGVASSATSVTLAALENRRQALSIYNASTQNLYVNFTNAASIASGGFVLKIPAGGYFELPIAARGVFTGKITGIWDVVDGYAEITEYKIGV